MARVMQDWMIVLVSIRYKRNPGWSTHKTLYPMVYDAGYLKKRLGLDTYTLHILTGDIVPFTEGAVAEQF